MLERLGCSLSIFYGEGEEISSSFEQKLFGLSSTLKYDISRNLKGSLAYTYSQQDTDDETSGYSKNTLFLGLVAEFWSAQKNRLDNYFLERIAFWLAKSLVIISNTRMFAH